MLDTTTITDIARSAVDLRHRPGYAVFTSGRVEAGPGEDGRWVLRTDCGPAASAVRRALRDRSYATERDEDGAGSTITVWPVRRAPFSPLPPLSLREEVSVHRGVELGSGTWVLEGPLGRVEQQYGSGGHNDMAVHAVYPFAGAGWNSRCVVHPAGCWWRWEWPLQVRARRFIVAGPSVLDRPVATARLAVRLRILYRMHVHGTAQR
ncbi:hypothetical protein LN042_23080 [Kitasatospora sp. RB6PN24]|uniref:hypothetical protein n=1 Tax=Kitasatospora humi TaxID=2893891 RepID=UPI001E2EC0AF|nr:hypothetical protein [Kitasatospora humi]MCC9309920.1 hypothetical protein [Kitasatospora humi]